MYYLVENHYGDDNDNSITDIIVEAKNNNEVFSKLKIDYIDDFWKDAEEDGDDEVMYLMKYEESDDPENPIPLHNDYYITESFKKIEDAREARARYHGYGGELLNE